MSLLLLDSASLYYRAYFALPDSITGPDGTPVNAVRGFLETLAALARERHPERIVACWDEDWRPQWRVDLVPTYKTHRVATEADLVALEEVPDTLGPQIGLIADALDALGVPVIGRPGEEADDVIATLALSSRTPVDIASGDRDLIQLVGDSRTLLFTGGTAATRGGAPWLEITPAVAEERYGVPPDRYADLAVLRGDPSDGLPGVAGIGEKTAVALIGAFGGLESILAAAADPASPRPMTERLRGRLIAAAADVRAADQVVRLRPRSRIPAAETRPRAVDEGGLAGFVERWGLGATLARVREALGR